MHVYIVKDETACKINDYVSTDKLSLLWCCLFKCDHSSQLALWGNKNWLPSMKVKKLEKFQYKMGLKGCKWSSLIAPGTEIPLCHPYWKMGKNSPNSQN